MTITFDDNQYHAAMAISGGAVAAAFALWVALRGVHRMILAGAIVALAGASLLSYSLYCQKPQISENYPSGPRLEEHRQNLAEWEARPAIEREWVRPLWPVFVLVTAMGVAMIIYVWNCYVCGYGDFATREKG